MSERARDPEEETTEHPTVAAWPEYTSLPGQVPPAAPFAPGPIGPAPTAPPPPAAPPSAPIPSYWWSPAWNQPQAAWMPPPAYAARQPYRGDTYGHSTLAMIAGVLLMVIGSIVILIGVGILFLGLAARPFLATFDPAFPGTELLTTVGLSVLVVGVLEIAAAVGVFEHRGWARWVGVILAVIGLVFGFFALLGALSDPSVDGAGLVISVLWVAANGFIVAGLAAGWEHFDRR